MSAAPEEVSPAPVVAAAIQVSEAQETRDAANGAAEEAQVAQATAEVAGNTALAAEEDAQIATEVAVAGAEIGVSAAVEAEEAQQTAGAALSEVGQLRQDLSEKLDGIYALLAPKPEPETPEDGVTEVVLDGSDIGESGLESEGSKQTPVSGDNAGDSGAAPASTGNSGSRRRSFARGRR